MIGVREGYPQIDDEVSPLWAAQQAGWPDHTVEEAWRAALGAAKVGFASSGRHPAFDPGYIVNAEATRPADEPVVVPAAPGKDRR